jgi:hypothetical protein
MKNLLLAATAAFAFSACFTESEKSDHVLRVVLSGERIGAIAYPMGTAGAMDTIGFGIALDNFPGMSISALEHFDTKPRRGFSAKWDSSGIFGEDAQPIELYRGMPCTFSEPEGTIEIEGVQVPVVVSGTRFGTFGTSVFFALLIDPVASEAADARVDFSDNPFFLGSVTVSCPNR